MKKLLLSFVLLFSFCGTSFADFDITYDDSPTKLDVQEEKEDSTDINDTKVYASVEKEDSVPVVLGNYEPIDQDKYNQKLKEDEKLYSKYEDELGEDYYTLYRIVEKIIRANNLYNQHWRVEIVKRTEDFNAYSTSGNLIVVNSALYDTYFDNEDALAFVLAHEIAHLIFKHQRSSNINRVKIKEYDKITNAAISSNGPPISDLVMGVAGLSSEIAKHNEYRKLRKLEFEADEKAVVLVAKAGYNPRGGLETLDFISGFSGVYRVIDDHPSEKKRAEKIREVVNSLDLNRLKDEGQRNLYYSNVLRVKKSSDKKSIIIIKPKEKQL